MVQVWVGEHLNTEEVEKGVEYDTRIVFYAGDDWGEIRQSVSNTGLFPEKKLIVLRGLLLDTDSVEKITTLKDQIDSAWITVFLYEPSIKAPIKKKLEQHDIVMHESSAATPKKGRDTQVFAITDALLKRDRKSAWVAHQKAVRAGKAPEEIIGLIWWQVKTMLLVEKLDTKSGVKPFVYKKTKQSLQKYKKGEVEGLARKIVNLYHDSRQGGLPLESACENMLLAL